MQTWKGAPYWLYPDVYLYWDQDGAMPLPGWLQRPQGRQ